MRYPITQINIEDLIEEDKEELSYEERRKYERPNKKHESYKKDYYEEENENWVHDPDSCQ